MKFKDLNENIDSAVDDQDKLEELDYNQRKQHKIDDNKTLHKIKKFTMIGLAILCAVIVVVYVLNTIFPVRWVWLSTEQMADIRSLAISILIGVIASLINNYFWRK